MMADHWIVAPARLIVRELNLMIMSDYAVEDGKTMQLVPKDLHATVRHIGGAAIISSNAANVDAAAKSAGG